MSRRMSHPRGFAGVWFVVTACTVRKDGALGPPGYRRSAERGGRSLRSRESSIGSWKTIGPATASNAAPNQRLRDEYHGYTIVSQEALCHSPIPPVTPRRDFGEAMAVIGLRKIHFLAFPTVMVAAVSGGDPSIAGHRGVASWRRPPIHPVRQHQAVPDPGRWEAAASRVFTSFSTICSRRSPAGQGQRQGQGRGMVGFIRRNFSSPSRPMARGPQRCSRRTCSGASGAAATRRPSRSGIVKFSCQPPRAAMRPGRASSLSLALPQPTIPCVAWPP